MTIHEFKDLYPNYANLEGDDLWNAMESSLANRKRDNLPLYKRYKLRYLFYKKKKAYSFVRPVESSLICKNCRKGSSYHFMILDLSENGKSETKCVYCRENLIQIPNTNISYKLWKFYRLVERGFWEMLQFLHIVKWDTESRYSIFGDENKYVRHVFSENFKYEKTILQKRKWYEYIFIKVQ